MTTTPNTFTEVINRLQSFLTEDPAELIYSNATLTIGTDADTGELTLTLGWLHDDVQFSLVFSAPGDEYVPCRVYREDAEIYSVSIEMNDLSGAVYNLMDVANAGVLPVFRKYIGLLESNGASVGVLVTEYGAELTWYGTNGSRNHLIYHPASEGEPLKFTAKLGLRDRDVYEFKSVEALLASGIYIFTETMNPLKDSASHAGLGSVRDVLASRTDCTDVALSKAATDARGHSAVTLSWVHNEVLWALEVVGWWGDPEYRLYCNGTLISSRSNEDTDFFHSQYVHIVEAVLDGVFTLFLRFQEEVEQQEGVHPVLSVYGDEISLDWRNWDELSSLSFWMEENQGMFISHANGKNTDKRYFASLDEVAGFCLTTRPGSEP